MPNRWNKPTKIVFDNNYFGENPGLYNLMELNCAVKDGSSISNNTFVKGAASHNFINLYQLDDNATINIDGNSFDCSANTNPIRIAARDVVDANGSHAPHNVIINIRNNTFSATDWDPEWAGILFFQPYDNLTSDFSGISVNLSGNVNNSNQNQLFYFYIDNTLTTRNGVEEYRDTQYMANATDTSKFPTIYVDGVKLSDEELLARVVAWDSKTNSVVSLADYFAPAGETPEPLVEEEGN